MYSSSYNYFYVGCQPSYIDGILWNRHLVGGQARVRCSRLYRSFRPGVYITRMCNDNKEWGDVDYSSCTMRPGANPLIMFEIIGTVDMSASSVVSEVCISR